jgi:RecA-family ATPase
MAKIINAETLFTMEYPKDLNLWGDFIFRGTLNALIGGSDTGKSTLLRQLGLAIAAGAEQFLGCPLKLRTRSALIVSIEDGDHSVAQVFQERYRDLPKEGQDRLDFMFELEESAAHAIARALEKTAYDVVFIDCYSDAYTGKSGNDQMETKRFLREFDILAKKYNIAIVFLHHLNKAADESRVTKGDATGSAAFEQKMRSIFTLTKTGYSSPMRHLKIVKGNYASNEAKQTMHSLMFNQETLRFEYRGSEQIDSEKEVIEDAKKIEIVRYLLESGVEKRGQGITYDDAPSAVFEEFGIERKKGALHSWVKKLKHRIDEIKPE